MKKVILFLAAFALGVLVFGPGLLFSGCSGEEGDDDDDGSIRGMWEPGGEEATATPPLQTWETTPAPCVTVGVFRVCDAYLSVASTGEVFLLGTVSLLSVSTDTLCAWLGTEGAQMLDYSCQSNLSYPLTYGIEYAWVLQTSMGGYYPGVWDSVDDLVYDLCDSSSNGSTCLSDVGGVDELEADEADRVAHH